MLEKKVLVGTKYFYSITDFKLSGRPALTNIKRVKGKTESREELANISFNEPINLLCNYDNFATEPGLFLLFQ